LDLFDIGIRFIAVSSCCPWISLMEEVALPTSPAGGNRLSFGVSINIIRLPFSLSLT
jgi:hypothetical protein